MNSPTSIVGCVLSVLIELGALSELTALYSATATSIVEIALSTSFTAVLIVLNVMCELCEKIFRRSAV